jgi:hypothetical protein
VELRRGVERGEADNRRTGVMVADKLPTLPFQRLFAVAWEELRTTTPADYGRQIESDLARWPAVVKAAGIQPQ